MINYESFTGGIFETNCYALEAPEGWILFDAPDGTCDWLVRQGIQPRLLLLTHGHIDHIQDVAKIKRRFGCPVGIHPDSAPMISDRDFFRDYGFQFEIEPVQPDLLIEGRPLATSSGRTSRCSKCQVIVPAVFVSSRAKTNCSSAATFSSPAASVAGICPAATAICSSPAFGKNSIR